MKAPQTRFIERCAAGSERAGSRDMSLTEIMSVLGAVRPRICLSNMTRWSFRLLAIGAVCDLIDLSLYDSRCKHAIEGARGQKLHHARQLEPEVEAPVAL